MSLQITPLNAVHRTLGAKMVPFAGWEMPVQYPAGILAEHRHTREAASLFDICHMGEFRITGAAAAAALDHALARAVLDQPVGTCRYNFLLQENGGVLDDLVVYRLSQDEFYIVVNAACIDNDAAVLRARLAASGVSFIDESAATAKLDLQGPLSTQILSDFKVSSLPVKRFHWVRAELFGTEMLISSTGYTGEAGYELYFPASEAERIWNLLLGDERLKPAGLGARDTLRLEAGLPLYGDELDTAITPVEAGFARFLKLEQPREFVGSAALRGEPLRYRSVGLLLEGRRAARHGAPVFFGGEQVGVVTSGSFAPSLGTAIAFARIDAAAPYADGTEFQLGLERGTAAARIVPTPFFRH